MGNFTRIKDMDLEEILKCGEIKLKEFDIAYFCDDISIIEEFKKKFNKKVYKEELYQFLIKNEKKLDKEKLVLINIYNYKDYIEEIKRKFDFYLNKHDVFEVIDLNNKLQQEFKILEKYYELAKGRIKTKIPFYYYVEDEGRFRVKILDSTEFIDAKKIDRKQFVKRLDNIDSIFLQIDDDHTCGLEHVISSLLLTDLIEVFSDKDLGNHIKTMIIENEIIRKYGITEEELRDLRTAEDGNKYLKLVDSLKYKDMLVLTKSILREYAEYIDINKLLLISAYRVCEGLEKDLIYKDSLLKAKEVLKTILQNVPNNCELISCHLESKTNNEIIDVNFSRTDIEKYLARFTSKTYLTIKEIEDYKRKIINKEINLTEIDSEYIDTIFSAKELEGLGVLSVENLKFVFERCKWDGTKLIELYEANVIPLSFIEEMKELVDFSEIVTFEKLDQYYNESKQNQNDEKISNKYEKYLDLYKEIFINGRNKEYIIENQNLIIMNLAEKLDKKEYIDSLKHYFEDNVLSLDIIAEWSGQDLIIELYNENLISLNDIEELVNRKIIPEQCLSNIYENKIWDETLTEEERVDMLLTGYISKQTIEKLFGKTLINDSDLDKLIGKNIISSEDKQRIIDCFDIEKAESEGNGDYLELIEEETIEETIFVGDRLKKISYGNTNNSKYNINSSQNSNLIIHPDARESLFYSMSAKKVRAIISEESPFKNYNFYIILGKDGKKHLNSPIIAERIYEDIDDEEKYATGNATYFFRYGDFLVLRNYLKKDEVVSAKNGVVYRAIHTIADGTKKGTWAASTIKNIIKVILESDLKEYKKEHQNLIAIEKMKDLYTLDELRKIFQIEEYIDSGNALVDKTYLGKQSQDEFQYE